MPDAQLVQLKKLGKENSQHKPTLEDEDLEKLKSSDALSLSNPLSQAYAGRWRPGEAKIIRCSLSLSNPLSLLRNVWFHIVLYFWRGGCEGQRELQKSTIGDKIVDTFTFLAPYFVTVIPFSPPSLSFQPPSPQTMLCHNCCDPEEQTSNIEWGSGVFSTVYCVRKRVVLFGALNGL